MGLEWTNEGERVPYEWVEWFGRFNIARMALMRGLSLSQHILDTMVIILILLSEKVARIITAVIFV
jgi:hypothetical protein